MIRDNCIDLTLPFACGSKSSSMDEGVNCWSNTDRESESDVFIYSPRNKKIAGSSVVSTSFSLVVETVAVVETAELVLAARQKSRYWA